MHTIKGQHLTLAEGACMTDLNALFQLINPDNTIVANRALAHAIGMAETIIYSALISKYTYYESHEMLIDNEWFFCTTADLQESTTFPPKQQKKAIDKLVEEGLIRVKLAGTPAKRHFSIKQIVFFNVPPFLTIM